jgi:hypothetical protein
MIASPDVSYTYPIGLLNFSLTCSVTGDSATVRIFFDADYSATSSTWTFRKWNGSSWSNVSPQPTLALYTFTTGPLIGQSVTTATYSLTDGGINDVDSNANSTIIDPIGPGILVSTPVAPSSGGGGGGGGFKNPLKPAKSTPVCSQNTQ